MNVHSKKSLEGVLALDEFKIARPRSRKVVENDSKWIIAIIN